MKKSLDRSIVVLTLAIAVTLVWSWVARTDWVSTQRLLEAGPGYLSVLSPLLDVAGATIVAVAGVQLVRHWWVAVRAQLGPPRRARVPSECRPSEDRELVGAGR